MPATITEPARTVPIADEVDLCVVGGSCTGVFAAVRAARLGLRVALIERESQFGGMATTAQVTHWHRIDDVERSRTIIAGLTGEILDRLDHRRALFHNDGDRIAFKFNPAVLACELDDLVASEERIRPFLCSVCSTILQDDDGRISTIVIEDRSGRRAIRARQFIDASGDAVLVRAAGLGADKGDVLQPASYQVTAEGLQPLNKRGIWDVVRHLKDRYGFPESNPWDDILAGCEHAGNVFGARMHGIDASDPDQLTQALMRGRRHASNYLAMIREGFGEDADGVQLVAVAQALGVRETWHPRCQHRITRDELLSGTRYADAIANGTYPVDVHAPHGTSLLYLDGRESFTQPGGELTWKRWRDEGTPTPPCYHIPYRSLVPVGTTNLLVAGRLMDADQEAFGALRVMVTCNQTGEAAGVAAAIACERGCNVDSVPTDQLRRQLADGGSVMV